MLSPYLSTSWYGYDERLSGTLPSSFPIHDSKQAVDFIRRNRGSRFYLKLNFMQNHRDDDRCRLQVVPPGTAALRLRTTAGMT